MLVDAQRFLALWRKDPHHGVIARGDPSSWRLDRKFQYAGAGFDAGPTNPVPLARVVCQRWVRGGFAQIRNRVPAQLARIVPWPRFNFVGFCDGITRTIWLLSHGADAFPVICDRSDGAMTLCELAGYPQFPAESAATIVERLLTEQPFATDR